MESSGLILLRTSRIESWIPKLNSSGMSGSPCSPPSACWIRCLLDQKSDPCTIFQHRRCGSGVDGPHERQHTSETGNIVQLGQETAPQDVIVRPHSVETVHSHSLSKKSRAKKVFETNLRKDVPVAIPRTLTFLLLERRQCCCHESSGDRFRCLCPRQVCSSTEEELDNLGVFQTHFEESRKCTPRSWFTGRWCASQSLQRILLNPDPPAWGDWPTPLEGSRGPVLETSPLHFCQGFRCQSCTSQLLTSS